MKKNLSTTDIKNLLSICNIKFEIDHEKYLAIKKSYEICNIKFDENCEEKYFFEKDLNIIREFRQRKIDELFLIHSNSKTFMNGFHYYCNFGKDQKTLLDEIILQQRKINNNISFTDNRTGRLSIKINGNDFYSFDKQKFRAQKDYIFVQLDFISSQPRLFLYSVNNELYMENDIYENLGERQKIKKQILVHLFSNYDNKKLNKIFDKNVFMSKFKIINNDVCFDLFKRPVFLKEIKQNIVVNNLLQCIERNVLLNSMFSVSKLCKQNNINAIIFSPFHDACILQLHKDCVKSIHEIKDAFENGSKLPNLKMFSKVRIGKRLSNMRLL